MIRHFSDMEVWQMSNGLAEQVFEITGTLPRSEDYGLTSQIRRAANSVSANIAEAFGRSSKRDKRRFYIIARGSAFETQSHLLYGAKVKYFEYEKVESLKEQYQTLVHQINKILKALNPQP